MLVRVTSRDEKKIKHASTSALRLTTFGTPRVVAGHETAAQAPALPRRGSEVLSHACRRAPERGAMAARAGDNLIWGEGEPSVRCRSPPPLFGSRGETSRPPTHADAPAAGAGQAVDAPQPATMAGWRLRPVWSARGGSDLAFLFFFCFLSPPPPRPLEKTGRWEGSRARPARSFSAAVAGRQCAPLSHSPCGRCGPWS